MTLSLSNAWDSKLPGAPGKPERADTGQLLTHLRAIRDFRSEHAPEGLAYSCIEDFVLRHGRIFDTQRYYTATGVRRGRMKQCFKNAFTWAHRRPDLFRYCEGIAVGAGGLPVVHAWVIDRSGKVIDPTWKDQQRRAYMGVAFRLDYVRARLLECHMYTSMLDGALLKVPYAILRGLDKPEKYLDPNPLVMPDTLGIQKSEAGR